MEKSTKIYIMIILILIAIIVAIVGFAMSNENNENTQNTNFGQNFEQNKSTLTTEDITQIEESADLKVEYTTQEESGSYSNYTAKIDVSTLNAEGNGVTISGTQIKVTSAGTYYFTGTNKDCNIVVEADKEAEVILVFDNCNITSTKTAVINGIKAKTIIVNLKDGSSNTFTDSSNYTEFTEDDEPNATVFSKTDLVINGSGKLVVNANYNDGIASKDTLKIVNANLEINAKDDGIRGKDFVAIKASEITIKSGGDGIKSTNEEEGLGYIVIDSGTIKIESGDDGIHAENNIQINGGKITISKSYEGIESKNIKINDGEIYVIASDDGINIAGGNDGSGFGKPGESNTTTSSSSGTLIINGGTIIVKANGDGLDSNGSILITGGDITVAGATNGGNGALDYDKSCLVTGGNLIAYGANGMWQNPSNTSTQYTIAFSVTGSAGDTVELKDSNGNTIASTKTLMSYGMICISNSKLQKGETYTLYVNGENKGSQELTSIVTSNGSSEGGMMMNGGGRQMMNDNQRMKR